MLIPTALTVIFTVCICLLVKVDIERTLADLLSRARLDSDTSIRPVDYLIIKPDSKYRRLAATVDMRLAANILSGDVGNENGHQCVDDIHSRLQKSNAIAETAIRNHIGAAVNNIIHNVWQRFINIHGERAAAVTSSQALMNR